MGFDAEPFGDFGSEGMNGEAEAVGGGGRKGTRIGEGGCRGFGPFFGGDFDFERLRFGGIVSAEDLEGEGLTNFFGADFVAELLKGIGALAVNGGNDVAGFQIGVHRGTVAEDARDEDAGCFG